MVLWPVLIKRLTSRPPILTGKETEIADRRSFPSFSAVGQMPFLDFLLNKNPVMHIGPPNLASVTRAALGSLIARQQGKDKNFDPMVPDLLHHFMETKLAYPDIVDDNTIMGYMLIPLLAGADTTAITIRAVFYFTLRNPAVYRKLQEEVLAAGFGTQKPAPYNAARALPCKPHIT